MTTRSRTSTESKRHHSCIPRVSARSRVLVTDACRPFCATNPAVPRYYFALVVQNQIVYLAMADKSISDIEAAHRFLKDISTKCATFSEQQERCGTCGSLNFLPTRASLLTHGASALNVGRGLQSPL